MQNYLQQLQTTFANHANPQIASGIKAYMRNYFEFLGIQSPLRKEIQKPFLLTKNLPPKKDLEKIVHALWDKPQREYQYAAMALVWKYSRQYEQKDMEMFEYMITHKSWWDTVDFIAAKPVGYYLMKYPDQRKKYTDKWIRSGNIWLQRTALLFQLTYKEQTDTVLLNHIIHALNGTREFFINKAIGWILRQYARVNPAWVKEFVHQAALSNLSRREALKNL